ncbi:hypothetical protein SPB21_03725 [Leptothoe sp. ISB3NOV94-8A]
MQTIPKFSTSPNGDNYTILWGSEVIGKIDFNITTLKWEYSRYSAYPAVVSGGTADECLKAAKQDYTLTHNPEPLAKVITKGPKSRPSGFYSDMRYISRNRVQRITIGGLDGSWTDDLWVPLSLANQLKVGSVVVPHRPDGPNGKLYLKWPKTPVRRSAVAA